MNVKANALAGVILYLSLHDGDPSTSGANELTGGSPAYARKSVTWNSASSGQATSSNQPVFDVGAGKTVAYVGFWSASSGGTFYGYAAVTSESYSAQGTYTVPQVVLDENA
jgi:hypothetical protein